ncbi:MAG: hypothetical protein LUD72_04455, partial [Bacteroidales bacterium]|nr:hypothetical protein [Bacteroidales bacterium]
MKNFFEKFDYIDYKYDPLLKGKQPGSGQISATAESILKKACVRLERNKDHNLYEKIDYARIHDNIKLIYADSDEADDYVFFYDFSLDYLIDRYVDIPLLNKLFSYHYFEYEWEQHVDMNFKKSDLSYYRDHVIHEIRNCYMIMRSFSYKLCDGETFYEKIEKTLKLRSNNISKYACAQVEQYVASLKDTVSVRSEKYLGGRLDDAMKSWLRELCPDTEDGEIGEQVKKFKESIVATSGRVTDNADDFAWNYLIRGSLIVAALFHDIGYPIRFVYKNNRKVSEYISLITPIDSVGFDDLYKLLHGSLLFTVTDKDRLKVQYDELDHGALSAYVLLLQFYQTGAINGLDPIKRAIIELAAVVIYEHTLKYEALGVDKGDRGKCDIRERPSFMDNPLTYTLRFVDDIQEWDRLYFETHEGSEYLFCAKCRMPIIPVWDEFQMKHMLEDLESFPGAQSQGDLRLERDEIEAKLSGVDLEKIFSLGCVTAPVQRNMFICGCQNEKANSMKDDFYKNPYSFEQEWVKSCSIGARGFHCFPTGNIEDGAQFKYQRINYTITCDSVILLDDCSDGSVGKNMFYIEYDPYKQLYALLLDHSALSYRIREISKVSKQFSGQVGIKLDVCSRITENPMMLKIRIFSDFLYELGTYVLTGGVNAHNPYRRNIFYYDLFKNHMGENSEDDFALVRDMLSELKRSGFLVYDYADEEIVGENTSSGSTTAEPHSFEAFKKLLDAISRESVMFFMGAEDEESMCPVFNQNLVSTLNCYSELLVDCMDLYNSGNKPERSHIIRRIFLSAHLSKHPICT